MDVQQFANTNGGQLLLTLGQQVARGADPTQAVASAAGAYAAQSGQTVQQFLATQGGRALQGYISAISGGASPSAAFSASFATGGGVAATAGLAAIGIPPPVSTLIGAAVGQEIGKLAASLFKGSRNNTHFPNLTGDKQWRAEKYYTKTLPSAFVDYLKANNLSIEDAVSKSAGDSPPWEKLSVAIATWLANHAWGTPFILLPGVTPGTGNQLGIGYTLPIDAGDGWNVPRAGWWWYPYLTADGLQRVQTLPASQLTAAERGPIYDMWDRMGVDIPATIMNVKAKGSAKWENVVFRPVAYDHAANAVEQAANTDPRKRTGGQKQLLRTAGVGTNAGGAALGLAALAYFLSK